MADDSINPLQINMKSLNHLNLNGNNLNKIPSVIRYFPNLR